MSRELIGEYSDELIYIIGLPISDAAGAAMF